VSCERVGYPELLLFGVVGEELLRGNQAFAELEVGEGEFGFVDDLFEGSDDGYGERVWFCG
jgi:hypothetical protein